MLQKMHSLKSLKSSIGNVEHNIIDVEEVEEPVEFQSLNR